MLATFLRTMVGKFCCGQKLLCSRAECAGCHAMTTEADLTDLLNAANSGDADAQSAAYRLVYDELKVRARRHGRVGPASSLTPTALVHELFLRLNQRGSARIQNRGHFFALAARAMRQIIVDHARRRDSVKRGGGMEVTNIEGNSDIVGASAEQALELDAALTELAVRDADLARVVEWHFFAGLTFKEIGEELGRHERTVFHDWQLARALLEESMGGVS
jgi:RNA polymerase sigma factor (TIGR02999 family)